MSDQDYAKLPPTKDSGSYLFLSVFLLLLAFFILLNAISTFEETKSRAVMDSMSSTFRSAADARGSAEIYVSNLGTRPNPEEVLEAMGRLWRTAIPIAHVEVVTPGRTMEMRMPANELFVGGEAELRSDREQLLSDVARALRIHAEGFVNELEFVVGSDWSAGEEVSAGRNVELARVAALAEELVADRKSTRLNSSH